MPSFVPYAHAAVDASAVEKVTNPIFTNIVDPLLLFAFALATTVFVYGVVKMIMNQGGDGYDDGKRAMTWGVIGLFVMLSAWGLINIVANTVGDLAR